MDDKTLTRLIAILESIRNEMTVWSPGWRENAYFGFMRMMVLLLSAVMPQAPDRSGQNAYQISRVVRMMEEDCARPYTLRNLAETAGMSLSCFRHHFTGIIGMPPMEYLMRLRLRKAVLLLFTENPIPAAAARAGFADTNYFARIIRKRFALTPFKIKQKFLNGEITAQELIEKLQTPE